MPVSAHFVTFLSPGTITSEQTTKPVLSWDVDAAVALATGISERHGATPYAFYFTTRGREDDELDSKVTDTSNLYYLGGRIETIEEVRLRGDPKERILLSNMECNGWNEIIVNDNSWRTTQPRHATDVILDWHKPG